MASAVKVEPSAKWMVLPSMREIGGRQFFRFGCGLQRKGQEKEGRKEERERNCIVCKQC
jgi:hypothetical protein